MAERKPNGIESYKQSAERSSEHENQRHEHEPMSEEKEREQRQEAAEQARQSAEKESVRIERPSQPSEGAVRITREDKKRAFKHSLSRIQSQLPATSKRFSKVIHHQAVERVSEVAEKTIARPSGMLGGSLAAALGLGLMLFFARRNGFALSGSELIVFLIVGWVIGVSLEAITKLLRRR